MPLTTQNWDGVTAPALPSGWTFTGTWTTETAVKRSGANAAVQNDLDIFALASFNTAATNADVTVSAAMQVGNISIATQLEGYVCARYSGQTFTGTSGYLAGIQLGTAEDKSLHLIKRVAGVSTPLATVGPSAGNEFAINIWYVVSLTCVGSTISVQVQRDSDSKYLKSDGTWQVGAVNAISLTDTSVSAAGYVGQIHFVSGGTLVYVIFDDFVATELGGTLTAGTLALGTVTNTSIGFTASAGSGGTAPIGQQLYRHTSANYTPPGTGTAVSGQTGTTPSDTTAVFGTTYYYKELYTDNVAATALSKEVAATLKSAPIKFGFIGDSIFKGTAGPTPASVTIPQVFGAILACEYGQRDVTIVNRAIDGETAQHWAADTGSIMTNALAAFVAAGVTDVGVLLGANDAIAGRTAAQFKTDLDTSRTTLVAGGMLRVWYFYPTYIPEGANSGATTAAATELTRQYLPKISELVNGTTTPAVVTDTYPYIADHPAEVQADQTHLLEAGVRAVAAMGVRVFDRAVLQVGGGPILARVFTGY